jgi:hypothetical protein
MLALAMLAAPFIKLGAAVGGMIAVFTDKFSTAGKETGKFTGIAKIFVTVGWLVAKVVGWIVTGLVALLTIIVFLGAEIFSALVWPFQIMIDSATEWIKVIADMWTIVKSFFTLSFTDHILPAINEGIRLLNVLASSLNTILPESIQIPLIPLVELAKGGIVTGPTLAAIGEGGESEVVAPLSKLPGLLASVGGGSTGGSGDVAGEGDGGGGPVELTIPVSVILGEVELGRAVVKITEDMIRRAGGGRSLRLSGVG